MVVVMGTIVWLSAIFGRLHFGCQCRCPFLPCEVPLLGESDRHGERLSLPGLGEHRAFFIAGNTRQSVQTFGVKIRIRCAQDSHPTCRGKRNLWEMRLLPKARAPRTARNTHAAAFRRGTENSCP